MPRLARLLASVALMLLLALGAAPAPALAQGFTEAQRAEVVEILRRALREDPSILRDALNEMQEADQRERREAQRVALARHMDALVRDPADPVRGNPRGDVTIVEFVDARCGYCKQMHPSMEALLRQDPNVRLVLKDLPILGPNSVLAARALMAAQRQDKHGPLFEALMTLRGEPTEQVLRQTAERAGLDWTRLRRDMDDPAITRRIDANMRLAQSLGVEGTPALVIGDSFVPGALDLPGLERLVAEARARR